MTRTNGAAHARLAVQQASAVGQPEGSAIYFALDSNLGPGDIPAVKDYFGGIVDEIGGRFAVGVYSDGVVCQSLLDSRICQYTWLSASRAYSGSKVFYKAERWSLAQDPKINQSMFGIQVDLNESRGDFGAFAVQLAGVQQRAVGARVPGADEGTPWMDWMRDRVGQIQATGAKPTDFTRDIFKHTNFPLGNVTPESCAATVCAALEETGYQSTHSAAAASYIAYGEECELRPGCICVFQWPSGHHHVDFCDKVINEETVRGLGGNQGHMLQDAKYAREYMVTGRGPVRMRPGVRVALRTDGDGLRENGSAEAPPPCKPYLKIVPPYAVPHNGWENIAPREAINNAWTVPALCAAYDWPTRLEGGGKIAIVELAGGWEQSDLQAFFESLGQPVPNVVDVSVDGTRNSPNTDPIDDPSKPNPDAEVALDIQIAGASYFIATGRAAEIRVYWARDIASAVHQAAQDGCDVCSISWGADEQVWGSSRARAMEAPAKAATDKGMVIFAASGDNDSGDGGSTPANVDVPASCPHVIGCGGTSKTTRREVVWNNNPGNPNGEGTGGGYSTIFTQQAFQVGLGAQWRLVPDVAGNADPRTGYQVVVHGQSVAMGGTSAVAPLYAGLFAAFGEKLGFVTPVLWKNQLCFSDVTDGDNGYFRAKPGPDPCTGLGVPIGNRLAQLFTSPLPERRPAPVAVRSQWLHVGSRLHENPGSPSGLN